jgi:RNA polymerase sigma-70 factor (ECF subfamily)
LSLILDAMKDEQRAVFVLYELEELTVPEIASLLEVPVGTATSRLRAAREEFEASLRRLRAREQFPGAKP